MLRYVTNYQHLAATLKVAQLIDRGRGEKRFCVLRVVLFQNCAHDAIFLSSMMDTYIHICLKFKSRLGEKSIWCWKSNERTCAIGSNRRRREEGLRGPRAPGNGAKLHRGAGQFAQVLRETFVFRAAARRGRLHILSHQGPRGNPLGLSQSASKSAQRCGPGSSLPGLARKVPHLRGLLRQLDPSSKYATRGLQQERTVQIHHREFVDLLLMAETQFWN